MTSLLPPSRALSRVSQLGAVPRASAHRWSRVGVNHPSCLRALLKINALAPILRQRLIQTFATKPGRPKAHTGRVTASKRKPAAARSDTAAGTPKKVAAKKAPAKKAPAKERTTTRKSAAKKPARKTRSPAKPKPAPKRKVLTDKQKAAKEKKETLQKTRDLRKIALLDGPKRLPATAFTVLSVQTSSKGTAASLHAKDVAAQYKTLSAEEMERLNHVANENKAKNDVAFKQWLSEHTPAEIKAANTARGRLRKEAKEAGRKTGFKQIQDERAVKQPRAPYNYFLVDRFASGDMKHMKIAEIGPLIGREWKALSEAEKKPFQDRAIKDKARYVEEYTTVYGKPPPFTTKKAKTGT